MFDLDSLKAIEHLDRQRVIDRLTAFPDEIEFFLKAAEKIKKLKSWGSIDKVVIVGMGGSGIGAEIAKNLTDIASSIPVIPIRDARIPRYVNNKTLVIGVSFSGHTQETIIAVQQAIDLKAQVVLICQENSPLDNISIENNLPVFHVTSPVPPRLAVPNLTLPILIVLDRIGALHSISSEIKEAVAHLRQLRDSIKPAKIITENPAKQLALKIQDYTPIALSSAQLISIPMRFAQEMNENAKSYAFYGVMPEYCHNGIEAKKDSRPFFYLMIRGSLEHPFMNQSYTSMMKILERDQVPYEIITLQGKTLIAQILYGIYFLDFVSYYSALLKKENPIYNENIDFYKKHLKK